jgi:hypothetical protein
MLRIVVELKGDAIKEVEKLCEIYGANDARELVVVALSVLDGIKDTNPEIVEAIKARLPKDRKA